MEPRAQSLEACLIPANDRTRLGRVRSLTGGIMNTIRLSRALVDTRRNVDLAGLDGIVGLLCAKALDLPPEQGRGVAPELSAMMREIDRLTASLRIAAGPPGS